MKSRKSFVFLLIINVLTFYTAMGQSQITDSLTNQLIERHKIINISKMTMPGYRVQIYFGSERTKANEMKAQFIAQFPLVSSYLVYQQPNFKVRVGDFKTRLEASSFLRQLEGLYSTAFIVPDEVKLPDIE